MPARLSMSFPISPSAPTARFSTGRSIPMPELRTIVITGAGTGIGAACARLYAAEGANLVLIGRRREPLVQLAEEIGGLVLVGDAACPTTWDGFVAQIRERYGRLDVLLACAGGMGLGRSEEHTSELQSLMRIS